MRHHPRYGHLYMPSIATRVDTAGGYLVRTNASGFRSDREFSAARRPGVKRALLFGDSQTDGEGCANAQRYGDLIEMAAPDLEIYNYGLTGTGPDQQLLIFEDCAPVDRDLVVIGLNVENVRRVNRRVIRARDANGALAYYEKPYFEIWDGELVLRNVPVPKRTWSEETLPDEFKPYLYSYEETNFFSRDVRKAPASPPSLAPLRQAVKAAAMRISKFQPLPDYATPDEPSWLLLQRILLHWISASSTPVLIVLIPHPAYLAGGSDASQCRARFEELAQLTGCFLYDPLPDLLRRSAKARRSYWSDAVGHLTPEGHAALAALIDPAVARALSPK
jgi:carbamoyltransferase